MKDINKSLKLFADDLEGLDLVTYERLPDIEIYMDQMLTYFDRVLNPFKLSTLDKKITSSMINNYVKGEVILKPENKKYSKEHILEIYELVLLKDVLQINNIKDIISCYDDKNYKDKFNEFTSLYQEKLHEKAKEFKEKLDSIPEDNEKELYNLALSLAINSSVNILFANRIFDLIRIKKDLKD